MDADELPDESSQAYKTKSTSALELETEGLCRNAKTKLRETQLVQGLSLRLSKLYLIRQSNRLKRTNHYPSKIKFPPL